MFAIEVLLGTMSLTDVLVALIACFAAVAVSWLLLPNVPTFDVAQLSITPSLPTMTFGALLGGLLREGWSHLAPATSKDSYAIVGSGAMLTSASQGPISSVIFMLELTNHTDALIVPLLVAVAGATLMARRLEVHSIYSIRR